MVAFDLSDTAQVAVDAVVAEGVAAMVAVAEGLGVARAADGPHAATRNAAQMAVLMERACT